MWRQHSGAVSRGNATGGVRPSNHAAVPNRGDQAQAQNHRPPFLCGVVVQKTLSAFVVDPEEVQHAAIEPPRVLEEMVHDDYVNTGVRDGRSARRLLSDRRAHAGASHNTNPHLHDRLPHVPVQRSPSRCRVGATPRDGPYGTLCHARRHSHEGGSAAMGASPEIRVPMPDHPVVELASRFAPCPAAQRRRRQMVPAATPLSTRATRAH